MNGFGQRLYFFFFSIQENNMVCFKNIQAFKLGNDNNPFFSVRESSAKKLKVKERKNKKQIVRKMWPVFFGYCFTYYSICKCCVFHFIMYLSLRCNRMYVRLDRFPSQKSFSISLAFMHHLHDRKLDQKNKHSFRSQQ